MTDVFSGRMRLVRTLTIDISEDNQVTQEAVDLQNFHLGAIEMPSAWTAASINFQAASAIDGTYLDVYKDDGNIYAMTVAVDQVVVLDDAAAVLAALQFIKIKSSAAQLANRALKLYLRQ